MDPTSQNITPNPFNHLPDDALHIILSKLTLPEVAKTATVSKMFAREVAKERTWSKELKELEDRIGDPISITGSNSRDKVKNLIENLDVFSKIVDSSDCNLPNDQLHLIHERDIYGDTLLHKAVITALYLRSATINKKLTYLLDQGANLNARNREGMTPLHIAAQYGRQYDISRDSGVFDFLLSKAKDQNFNLNQQDNHGRTILHLAAQHVYKNYDNVQQLLKDNPEKIDVHAKDHLGLTPIDYAIIGRNIIAFKELEKAGAVLPNRSAEKIDHLYTLLEKRDNEEKERKSPSLDKDHSTPVIDMNAMSLEDKIEFFYDLDISDASKKEQLFLDFVETASDEVIHLQDSNGNTLLHAAMFYSSPNLVATLLRKGSDPNVCNYEMTTPVDLAAFNNKVEQISLLLEQNGKLVITSEPHVPYVYAVLSSPSSGAKMLDFILNKFSFTQKD